MARLRDEVVGRVRSGDVLALVALGVHVDVKALVEAEGLERATPGTLHHRRHGGVLPGGAHPQAHLLTVAGVQAREGEAAVVVGLGILEAHDRQNLGAILGNHFLVGREVTGGKDDALVSHELDVAAVGLLGDNGGHAAGLLITNELLGHSVINDGRTLLEGVGLHGLDGILLTGGSAGSVVALGAEADGVVGTVVQTIVGLQEHLNVLAADDVDAPVHGLFGVVVAAHPHLLVDGEAGGALLMVEEVDRVETVDAVLLDDLVVGREVGTAAGNGLAGGGEQRDACALLGSSSSGADAGHASTHDNDVVLNDLGDVLVGDGVGGNLEAPLGQAVLQAHDIGVIHANALLGTRGRLLLSLVHGVGGIGGGRGGGQCGACAHCGNSSGAGSGQEVATRHLAHAKTPFLYSFPCRARRLPPAYAL